MDCLNLELNKQTFDNDRVTLYTPMLKNIGAMSAEVKGTEFTVAYYEPDSSGLLAFRSQWGQEFTPQYFILGKERREIEVKNGRSSNGYSPFIFLSLPDGSCLCITICWSGNWQLCFENGEAVFRLVPDVFSAVLKPGESLELPKVIVSAHPEGFRPLCENLRLWLEENWFPKSRIPGPTVEWNHWWTYEDIEITEELFCKNVDKAAMLGIELCTLDAGWFGDSDNPAHWTQCRGDWTTVNSQRFPHGLARLSEYVHRRGMKFGLWLEPEAMGIRSRLLKEHPEWEAIIDGKSLKEPYICLGAEGAADWLYDTIAQIADHTRCDWLKLDFNIDPQTGCNRADHGHQPGVGLYSHYKAYYAVLDRLRDSHPHVIIENCSSGGLRLDLEMMRHADVSFLSDPDELPHSLQCFWGAGLLFPPSRLLHWAGSQTREYPDGSHVFPDFPINDDTPEWKIIAAVRGAMLHRMGISRDLTALPDHAEKVFKKEIAYYKEKVFPLVDRGRLYHLTGQPLRQGERCDDKRIPPPENSVFAIEGSLTAFQLILNGKGCLFVFALSEGAGEHIRLRGLDPNLKYRIFHIDTLEETVMDGDSLQRQGIHIRLEAGHSALLEIVRI